MKKYIISILLLLYCFYKTNAQQINLSTTDSTYIQQNRLLLIQKLLINDTVNANRILDSLYVRGQKLNIEPLNPVEEFYALLGLKRFAILIKKSTPVPKSQILKPRILYPIPDTLFIRPFYNYVLLQEGNISESLEKSHLPKNEKDYINILLKYSRMQKNDGEINQDTINNLGYKYEFDHPRSKLVSNLSLIMRPTPQSTKWIGGLIIGKGKRQYSGTLRENIHNFSPTFFWFDYLYKKKISLSGGFNWDNSGKTKKAFTYEGEWPANEKIDLFEITYKLGYDLINNRKLRLTPNFGIAFTIIGYREIKDEPLLMNFTYLTSGLNCDYKIITSKYGANETSLLLKAALINYHPLGSIDPIIKGKGLDYFLGIGFSSAFRFPEIKRNKKD